MSPGSSDSLRYRWLDAIVEKEDQLGPRGSTVRHAALTLAAFMDDEGKCWPSLTGLARAMQRHRSTVVHALNELDAQGWIERDRGTRGRSTIYRAAIPVVAQDDQGSRVGATKVVAQDDQGSRVGATRTPQEHHMERHREHKKGDSILNYPFTTEVSEAFIRSRGRRCHPDHFPTLRDVALELKETYPAEAIIAAVRTLGRSDDPPEALPAYVEAVAA